MSCTGPKIPAPPTGGIRFDASPADARVYVNEKLSGTISTYADRPLLLRPGAYRVKIVAEGYYPEYVEVTVMDEIVPVQVSLVAVPGPLGVEIE